MRFRPVLKNHIRWVPWLGCCWMLWASSASGQDTPDPPPSPSNSAPSAAPSPPPAPEPPPAPGPPPAPAPTPTAAPVAKAGTKADGDQATENKAESKTNSLGSVQGPGSPTSKQATGGFQFGSYGRVITASDGRGGPGRNSNVVAFGSRLDESNYAELELRRHDDWTKPGDANPVKTYIVSTIAIGNPIFHYDSKFDAKFALRNLYLEEHGIGSDRLILWAGSRMYRGDDIYLLNFWPLDNLNTVGAGAKLRVLENTRINLHFGLNRVDDQFQFQQATRALPYNQLGTTQIPLLDRQRAIESLRVEHIIYGIGPKGGIKLVGYGELHQLPSGTREEQPGRLKQLPSDKGYVVGAQVGLFRGEKATFVNLFFRHARGLAAFGEWGLPYGTGLDETSSGAYETRIALAANVETGPVTVMVGSYFRSLRTGTKETFNFYNLDEGIFSVRPHVFFTDRIGLAAEFSYQAQQRAIIGTSGNSPFRATVARFGLIPFLSPGGKGSYQRPHLRAIWAVSARNDDARSLYPKDDPSGVRRLEQFFGVGAEWWFNSSYL
jgi:maltoporin